MPLIPIALAVLLCLGGMSGARAEGHGGGGAAKPAADEGKKPEAKKPKPKPKKPDKNKNCQWERDVELEIGGRKLSINQASLRNVMRGAESLQEGFGIFADTDKLELKLKAPDGSWYIADMTRLGDEGEGCIFYFVGSPHPVDGEPPLF
ncbi:MAG: hypothetical protein WCF85_04585 [Rhodospirillaceae bacterium]